MVDILHLFEIYGDSLYQLVSEDEFMEEVYYQYSDYITESSGSYSCYASVGVDIASCSNDFIEDFKLYAKDKDLSNDTIIILYATAIAKYLRERMNLKNAMTQGESYKNDNEKVEQYATKQRAYNKGFYDYLKKNHSGDYILLEHVIKEFNTYSNEKNK